MILISLTERYLLSIISQTLLLGSCFIGVQRGRTLASMLEQVSRPSLPHSICAYPLQRGGTYEVTVYAKIETKFSTLGTVEIQNSGHPK